MPLRRSDLIPLFVLGCAGGAALSAAGKYGVYLISITAASALAAVGLNALVGLTGQISLGHAAFYAIGAYTLALLQTSTSAGYALSFIAAGLLSGVAGLLLALPALRAEGPYLAMVTIAFGLVVEQGLAEWKSLTGGWNGISGLEIPALGRAPLSERAFASIILIALWLALAFFAWLRSCNLGLAMAAVRDAPAAARSVGVRAVRVRTLAFAISAMLTGIAGAFFATLNGFISPESFPFFQSIAFLLMVIAGGAGTIGGPVAGAFLVVAVPEFFSSLAEYRVLAIGALFLAVLRAVPGGLLSGFESLITERRGSDLEGGSEAASTAIMPGAHGQKTLSLKGLDLRFGGVHAVKNLSFVANPGIVTALIGPNGAGKSSALNAISGYYRPSSGDVLLEDEPVTGLAPSEAARKGIARTFQTSQLFGGLTVLENLLVAGEASPAGSITEQEGLALLRRCSYAGSPYQKAARLPHADRRLVEIARALALRPSVLLLDEPAAGLIESDKARLASLLKEIAGAGITVILVEHDMSLVASLSGRIVVLDAGAKIAEGTPSEVLTDPKVREAYLGSGISKPAMDTRPVSGRPVLAAKNLTAGYGSVEILRGVSLEVRRGETVAILGANGAGKSTLLRCLAGLIPARGEIYFDDLPIHSLTAERRARKGLVLVPEGRLIFPELTLVENLAIAAPSDSGRKNSEKIEGILARFPKLAARAKQRAGYLSGGEQQMLAIGRGLIAGPEVLMLDEPSLGLAPAIVDEVYEWLATLKRQGLTILLADQIATAALGLADRAYVLQSGAVCYEGQASGLLSDPALLTAYMGEVLPAP
jgi:ABC-type branched-subunit amino acid transport system ATPase component/ABC-type branched-subunit amino acid transport system permease subunit